jgi:DUF1009 family protein
MARKLGILAGGGVLPRHIVDACRGSGRDVFVLAFEGHTLPQSTEGAEHAWVRLGAVGAAMNLLKAAGVEDLVMAGPIRRPSMAELRPDGTALKVLARAGARALGDDGLLRAIIGELEREGFQVVGIDDVLQGILAPAGPMGRHAPDDTALGDIRRGVDVLRQLGAVDVGQAVVVQEGIVLGVEAAEGTDRLIARCAELAREGPGGVLVKLRKPGQEYRADLPTIGPETVRMARNFGLRGIVVEAGATLVLSAEATVRDADDAGLFITGIDVAE